MRGGPGPTPTRSRRPPPRRRWPPPLLPPARGPLLPTRQGGGGANGLGFLGIRADGPLSIPSRRLGSQPVRCRKGRHGVEAWSAKGVGFGGARPGRRHSGSSASATRRCGSVLATAPDARAHQRSCRCGLNLDLGGGSTSPRPFTPVPGSADDGSETYQQERLPVAPTRNSVDGLLLRGADVSQARGCCSSATFQPHASAALLGSDLSERPSAPQRLPRLFLPPRRSVSTRRPPPPAGCDGEPSFPGKLDAKHFCIKIKVPGRRHCPSAFAQWRRRTVGRPWRRDARHA